MNITQATTQRWGWVNSCGSRQDLTFDSPDLALKEMRNRLGNDYTPERIFALGFRLALVEVTVSPLFVIASVDEIA